MNKERLEELRDIVWADYECLSETGGGDVRHYTDILALIDAEIVRQSATDAAVKDAIEWAEREHGYCMRYMLFGDADSATLAIDALRQYRKPTDEAVRWAINWQESEKASAQNDWERAGAEWRTEPGTQEMHDERMAAFNLAIQALRQMKPSKWIPVSERLPEPINQTSGVNIKNTYLVARYENCNPKGYFYGYQLARYWKSGWSGIDGSYGLSVTHWMPLPKPPDDEINNERFLELCKQYGLAVQQDSQSPGIFLRQKDGTLREVTCFPPDEAERVTNVIQDSIRDGK